MIAGTWILVLLPLLGVLNAAEWSSSVPVPTVFEYRGTVRTLDDTFLNNNAVYQPLVFCTGVVLLFSRERGRRRARLDWTRRWGVLCSYVVLLLSATQVLFIAALVLAGIAAVFQSMPLKYQPEVTQLFVNVSSSYLLYGAHPMGAAGAVLVAFSSVVILLACVALFDALRSSGPQRLAALLLVPLGLFSLIHLGHVARYCLGWSDVFLNKVFRYEQYFWPEALAGRNAAMWADRGDFLMEAAKWCIVLMAAVWLTIAQLVAWRESSSSSGDHGVR
jgi:hypothetical protein